MSKFVDEDSGPPTLGSELLLVFFLCAGLSAALIAYMHLGEPETDRDSFAFPPLNIDRAKLENQRAGRQTPVTRNKEQLENFKELFYKLNLLQFKDQPPMEQDPQELNLRLGHLTDIVLTETQLNGFVSVGRPIFESCNQGLDALRQALTSGKLSLESAKSSPTRPDFDAYRKHCGNFLPILLEFNLMTPNGQWTHPNAPIIAEILQRYRWGHIASSKRPARFQITPYDYEILTRWRIEDPRAYPMPRRMAFLEEAKQTLPSYDHLLALGLLHAADKNWTAARDTFQQLTQRDPKNPEFKRRLLWLTEKARQSSKNNKKDRANPSKPADTTNNANNKELLEPGVTLHTHSKGKR